MHMKKIVKIILEMSALRGWGEFFGDRDNGYMRSQLIRMKKMNQGVVSARTAKSPNWF